MKLRKILNRYAHQQLLSYFKGKTASINENSISKQLFISSCDYADKTAIISDFQNINLNYSEVFQLSKRMAANFIDLGIKPGSRLGIYSPNNIEWFLIQYASCLADIIMVNINPAYKPLELKHGVNLVELDTLIVTDNEQPVRILNNIEYFLNENSKLKVDEESGKI